jgi:Transposase, Mutator family
VRLAQAIGSEPEAVHRRRSEVLHEGGHRLQTSAPKVAALLEQAEDELLAFYSFPREDWIKLRSTDPLERVNKEIGRRSDVVGIYPNDWALIRLAGMLLIEQNDEWLVQHRYLSDHSIRLVLSPPPMPLRRRERNFAITRDFLGRASALNKGPHRWRRCSADLPGSPLFAGLFIVAMAG